MSQPTLRTKLTHDPASMEGQSYAPIVVALKASASSGSGYNDIYTVPAGVWLEEAVIIITEAFDGSATVDFGLDSDTDALMANTEITEATLGDVVSTKAGSTAPDGMYFTALDVLRVEFGGSPTVGEVTILLKMWDLNSIAAHGLHNSVTI